MNDTLGPEGLVPSSFVFGEYPKVYTKGHSEMPQPRLTTEERASMLQSGRAEMQRHMAKARVARALKHSVPSAADQSFQPGDMALVWHEKIVNNRIGEWLGPFRALGVDESKKIVYIQDVKIGTARPFSVTQVKVYLPPSDLADSFSYDLTRGFR